MNTTTDLVLGIDAGTVGIRAGLFDLHGQPLGFSDQSYKTSYPRPGWAEQNPAEWWSALVTAVRDCLSASGIVGSRVIGLAIDAPCDIFLTDREGIPLTSSLMWMDVRANMQAQSLTATHDPVLRYCGGDVPAEWPVPKALWLKQHEPALWERATYLVEQMGWLNWRLTGEWAVPLNTAAAKWHYRATAENGLPAGWPLGLLRSVGLDDLPAKVPGRVIPMGAKAGEMTSEAARELGLQAPPPANWHSRRTLSLMLACGDRLKMR